MQAENLTPEQLNIACQEYFEAWQETAARLKAAKIQIKALEVERDRYKIHLENLLKAIGANTNV